MPTVLATRSNATQTRHWAAPIMALHQTSMVVCQSVILLLAVVALHTTEIAISKCLEICRFSSHLLVQTTLLVSETVRSRLLPVVLALEVARLLLVPQVPALPQAQPFQRPAIPARKTTIRLSLILTAAPIRSCVTLIRHYQASMRALLQVLVTV